MRLTGLPTDCNGCHKDVHLGQLGASCQNCHSTSTFELKSYTHRNKALSGFFVDKHASAPCASCHRKKDGAYPAGRGTAVSYTVASTNCAACHDDAHKGALGNDCASCHDVRIWKTPNRAFHKGGTFPLEGQHLATPCASCHWSSAYKGTPNRCYDCHWIRRQDDLYRTLLGSECENCHRPTSWTAVNWNHAAQTGFPLNAPHSTLRCDQCHKSKVFSGTPTDCNSCHAKDYQSARNPNHVAGGFPRPCESCHRPGDSTWHSARFDHTAAFPLAGVHATQPCAACHKNRVVPGDAEGLQRVPPGRLHEVRQPEPRSRPDSGPPARPATSSRTRAGAWRSTRTPSGHSSARTRPRPARHATPRPSIAASPRPASPATSRPISRHRIRTTPPRASRQPATRATSSRIRRGTRGRSTTTRRSLSPASTPRRRAATCHKNSVFKGTPRDCVGCHNADFQASKNPPHVAAGFSTSCETCHKYADPAWKGATFVHTAFRLAGVHTTQACASCHKNSVFKGTPRDCVGCHNTDFQNSKNPAHVASGFPTTCDTCHKFTDSTWQQGTFTNALRGLPARGRAPDDGMRLVPREQQLHDGAQEPVLRLPPGRLPVGIDPRQSRRPVDGLRDVPPVLGHDVGPEVGLQPPGLVRARRGSRHDALRELPQERQLHDGPDQSLLRLPPLRLPGLEEPAACRRPASRRPATPVTSSRTRRGSRGRSRRTRPSSRWPAPTSRRPATPCHENNNFTTVPKSPCSACHMADFQSANVPGPAHGLLDRLRHLPPVLRHDVGPEVRLQPHALLRPRRRPHHGALRPVPQEQQLPDRPDEPLLRLPYGGLPDGDGPGEPRRLRFPDHVRLVPQVHRHALVAGDVQPRLASFLSRALTPPRPAPSAT